MDIERIADFWMAQVVGIGPVGRKVIDVIFGSVMMLFLSSSDEVYTLVGRWRTAGESS